MARGEHHDVVVVGAGVNGLTAAALLAVSGRSVLVLERSDQIGGACKSEDLTGDGSLHDTCATVHALGAVSPVFHELGVEDHGVKWITSPDPVVHPVEPDRVAVLHQSVEETAEALRDPGWARLFGPLVRDHETVVDFALSPQPHVPRSLLTGVRFGLEAVPSARLLTRVLRSVEGRALFAGLAAHSFLPLDQWLTASLGIMLGVTAHTGGWPIAAGGSQTIPDALAAIVLAAGGEIRTGHEVRSAADLPPSDALFLDLTPRQVLSILGDDLPQRVGRGLRRFRYGPGVCKVDFVVDRPVPWASEACARAATVHLGGTFEEVAAGEAAVNAGRHPDRPFVLTVQPSLFDPARAAGGNHVLWAYCHVPHGSPVDMTDAIEQQIERFAPGFRSTVLHRGTIDSRAYERRNPNNVGGDISGGSVGGLQLFFRPRLSPQRYRLGGSRNAYLCSASTPPGPGVHGMCGKWAVRSYLRAQRSP